MSCAIDNFLKGNNEQCEVQAFSAHEKSFEPLLRHYLLVAKYHFMAPLRG